MFVRVKILLLATLLSTSSSADLLCAEGARELVALYQKGAVRLTKDPVADWIAKSGDKKLARAFINQLEDEIIKVLEITPETRQLQLKTFAENFGFSEQQAKDVVLYYATNIYEEPRLAHPNKRRVFAQLSELLRAHRLTEPSTSAELRYPYYLLNISKLSVPEMAKQLGRTENEVYNDLSSLKISIENEFREYETAKEYLDAGFSIREVGDSLGIGEQALAFLMHYKHEKSRAREWDRSDENLIVSLRAQGSSVQEIADHLNRVHGVAVDHEKYRTAGAVQAKLEFLGEARADFSLVPRREIEPYGFVKDHGRLQPAAKQYLEDHYFLPLDMLANELRVTKQGLRQFIRRHSIVLLANSKRVRNSDSTDMMRGYRLQRDALARELEQYIIKKGYQLPRNSWRNGSNSEEVRNYQRLRATNSERIRRVFTDPKAIELALRWRIERRDTSKNPLLDMEAWIIKKGYRLPKNGDYKKDVEEARNYQRLKHANIEDVNASLTDDKVKKLVADWLLGYSPNGQRQRVPWGEFEKWIIQNNFVLPKCIKSRELRSDLDPGERLERQMYAKLVALRPDEQLKIENPRVAELVTEYLANKRKNPSPIRAAGSPLKALEDWIIANNYRLPGSSHSSPPEERRNYARLKKIASIEKISKEISDPKVKDILEKYYTTRPPKTSRPKRAIRGHVSLEKWIIDHGYSLPTAGRRGPRTSELTNEEHEERIAYAALLETSRRGEAKVSDPRVKELIEAFFKIKRPNVRGTLISRTNDWIIANGYRLPSRYSDDPIERNLAMKISYRHQIEHLVAHISDPQVVDVLRTWKPLPKTRRKKKE